MDIAQAVATIQQAATVVALVGTTVLFVLVMLATFGWVRNAIDDYEQGVADAEDDWRDHAAQDFYFECGSCGVNSIDDAYLFDGDEPERCPQCGEKADA